MKHLMLAFALAFIPMLAQASDVQPAAQDAWASDVAVRQSQIDAALAPIRSHAALRAHMRHAADSPLYLLSGQQRQQFIQSLVFVPEGLASYSFVPFEQGLSVTDAYRVLALFGAQSSLATILNLHPVNEAENAMLEVSGVSTMAAIPPWAHGICVINGGSRRCVHQSGDGDA